MTTTPTPSLSRRLGPGATSLFVVALGAGLLAQNPRNQHNPGPESFVQRVVATGLGNPWEVTWGPDGFLWVTERTAFRVTRINPEDGSKHVALTLDDVYQSVDQDGLLGLALHPALGRGTGLDHVFVAYAYDADPGPGVTRRLRVRRYTYDAAREILQSPLDILSDLPAHDDHGGARLAIGPDGKLYLTRGDQGSNFLANFCIPNRAQDLPTSDQVRDGDWSTYQGKILRLNLDGSIPPDNPVLAGVRSHIYTYGHRNPQGLVVGPRGLLYAAEHGPSTDALTTLFTVPSTYDFATLGTATIAPGGIDLYTSAAIPGWANSILVTGMRAGAVYRLKLGADGRSVDGAPVDYFRSANRFRDIALGPDGRIFLVTDDHGVTSLASGLRTGLLENPGMLLEYTFKAP